MDMPFGKYKGVSLDKIPDHYLLWALDNCEQISDTLRQAIRAQLRVDVGYSSRTPDWEEIVQTWYQQMARDYQPEKVGSVEPLRAINAGYARLRRMLGMPAPL